MTAVKIIIGLVFWVPIVLVFTSAMWLVDCWRLADEWVANRRKRG